MGSLALGLLLPLIQFLDFSSAQVMPEVSAIYHQKIDYITQLSTQVNTSANDSLAIDWTLILFALISIGMAMMLIRNLIAGYKINSLYRASEKLYHDDFTEVRTQKEHLPFSFFSYIFFSAFGLSEKDRVTILNHEIHHVRARHTWDILFVEAIKVFFWWNPIVYFYKKSITENHEFAADAAAISQCSRKDYCTLLLQSNMPGVNLNLGHPFFSTYIKKRIDMMYRKNSSWKSYLKFVLPICAIFFMAFILKEDSLELDYTLDSDYIDLYADDELLVPNEDYILDREKGKVIVLNRNDTSKEGAKYCMFIIDEPRDKTEFEKMQSLQNFTDYVLVHLDKDGKKTVGTLQSSSNEILDLVEEKKGKTGKNVKIKLNIDDEVKSAIVTSFLKEAASQGIMVMIGDENDRTNSPSNLTSPAVSANSNTRKSQQVDIDKNGDYSIGEKVVSFKEVEEYLQQLDRTEYKSISISPASDAPFNKVTKLLDVAYGINLPVILANSSSVEFRIPSISPLAPKSIMNRGEKSVGYGMRMHPIHKLDKFHKGIDLLAKSGTPVFATANGIVSKAVSINSGYGNHVIIDHQNGYKTLYAHLKNYNVEEGASIHRGHQLGTVGSSGVSTSPHLHYEVRLNDKAVDPKDYGAAAYLQIREKEQFNNQRNSGKSNDEKLTEGAKNMFGIYNNLTFLNQDSIIKLGLNVNRGVIVKAGDQLLTEGVDYELDYQLGRLKILNEDFLNANQPIKVEFVANESDKIMYNDNGKTVVAEKVQSDMTYDGECIPNKKGEYFMADKMPTLATCNTGNVEEDLSCTKNEISDYMNENKLYPETLIKKGFQGMLMFKVVVDEKGNIESYQELLREKRGDDYPELVTEGNRLMELVKANKKLSPAQCNGKNVKSLIHLSVNYYLNDEQLKRVIPRNASNTSNPNQRAVINYITDQGNMAYYYESKMSVPFNIKVTDPNGEIVLDETHSFLYNVYRDAFFVPNRVNGEYKIEVTQDGKTITSKMKCEVF